MLTTLDTNVVVRLLSGDDPQQLGLGAASRQYRQHVTHGETGPAYAGLPKAHVRVDAELPEQVHRIRLGRSGCSAGRQACSGPLPSLRHTWPSGASVTGTTTPTTTTTTTPHPAAQKQTARTTDRRQGPCCQQLLSTREGAWIDQPAPGSAAFAPPPEVICAADH